MLDELFPETNDDSVAILLTYGTAPQTDFSANLDCG
jgi:hypothetical protein